MNVYGNSKKEEELIKMVEEMQDEMEMMRNSLTEKDKTIADLNGQLQTSVPSSAVSRLKNKIQEQADEIVSLNAYIGKMNSADLIVKENEKLKEENSKIVREAEEAVKLAHKEADERKERIEKQAAELIVSTHKVFAKKEELDKIYAEEIEYIKKKAAAMSEDTRKRCAETYSERDHKLKADCLAKVTAHNYIILSLTGYGILSTVLSIIIMAQYLK